MNNPFSTLNPKQKEFIKALSDHGADYVLTGGFAMRFHGKYRNVEDCDILIGNDSENVERIIPVILPYASKSIDEIRSNLLKPNIYVQVDQINTDLITGIKGFDFKGIKTKAVETKIDDMKVLVISSSDLLETKIATARKKDYEDIEYLKKLVTTPTNLMYMTCQKAEQRLKQIFGFEKFYENQWAVIEKIFQGKRVLMIEKTGFGKSLCFQFPATQFEGTTVVFCPLIALMRDQVKKLQAWGISAACINSNQTEEENAAIIVAARQNSLKILYIAPERMENAEWLQTAREMNLAMVVVDEAHCISVWGHDFRPAYRRIINLVNLLPAHFPVLATTATATKRVEQDIMAQIGREITCVRGNLLRKNLHLRVVKVSSEEDKMVWIGQNIEILSGTGIIYTGTRSNAEIYAQWLNYLHISAASYHGRYDPDTRMEVEEALLRNEYKCVVSTNALGMGIDKPDIGFIIHTQVPQSPVHYYQEIGRAGRDGNPTLIILFYSAETDKTLPLSFIESGKPSAEKYEKVIGALKEERLGERQLMCKTNLKQTQLRVIKADLVDQGIISEVMEGKSKKYEYRFNAPELDMSGFETLRRAKLNDFDAIISYIVTSGCRMQYLCEFLGDPSDAYCGHCDNDTGRLIQVAVSDEWATRVAAFQAEYFPVLDTKTRGTNLVDGVAGAYYGFSRVGKTIHRCKYQSGGDFPDFLVELTAQAFHKHYGQERFDVLVYTPPTESGNLLKTLLKSLPVFLTFLLPTDWKKQERQNLKKFFKINC